MQRYNIIYEKNPREIVLLKGRGCKWKRCDIETGLEYFTRICVNIMTPCTAQIKPSGRVIKEFISKIYPIYKNEQRIDILLTNTDFGVG